MGPRVRAHTVKAWKARFVLLTIIQRIEIYSVDSRYPAFEQPGPDNVHGASMRITTRFVQA